jgi:predicted RNA-binding Zn-ribbon protein involved in translation (DUF1610 family)
MSYSAEPGHVESFRDATDNHEKMRGMMFLTFRCPECGQSKSIKGRKSRGWKIGFRCAECHMEKSAAKSADAKTAASSVR